MPTDKQRVQAVMRHFRKGVDEGWDGYLEPWPKEESSLMKQQANAFFIGMMFDMQIPAERAWRGGKHLVANHFRKSGGKVFSWEAVAETHLGSIRRIMRTGFDGGAYHHYWSRMAGYLKNNARLICDQYGGDVRRVWTGLEPDEVDLIYRRLIEFSGFGYALAKMGQFALVRGYGAAGGELSRKLMSVKPDKHVNQVTFRLGLVSEPKPRTVAKELAALDLDSPADFDLVVWQIGQSFCRNKEPDCENCPLRKACDYGLAA